MTISTLLEQITQLDALLTKTVHSGDRDAASLSAVTELGERFCAAGGTDLMIAVQEIVGFDPDDGERRTSILELCWDGVGDDHESFVLSKSFRF
jgi:hypothetical protein